MDILTLLVVIPVLTMLVLFFADTLPKARIISAIGMGIELIVSFVLLYKYYQFRGAGDTSHYLFYKDVVWYSTFNIHYTVGIDGIAMAMIMLTSIVIFTGIFASWNMEYLSKEFFISLILLVSGVYGFFISLDLFTMFLFYEIAVIPMYLLIGIWGSGPKEYSAMKLTLMLMGASAFLLVGILGIYYFSGVETGQYTFNIIELANHKMPYQWQMFFFPLTFVGFGVLGALFPFHTWSPDGHASAPTAVSMLHAGVLMKLGGYGALKVAMYLMPEAAQDQAWIFLILTGISVVYGAFGAIVQTDLKYINAYSSVSHCGLVLFAILMMNKTAMNGAVLQMISHGLMTALFFALIGMIYGRTHTRLITQMGGLMKVMPFLAVAYVIAGFASLGLPGLSGFVAEMTIFVGSFQHTDPFHRVLTIAACASIVITAVYILRVVGKILFGPVIDEHHLHLTDATWYEKLTLVTLIVSIAFIGIMPSIASSLINEGLLSIVAKF